MFKMNYLFFAMDKDSMQDGFVRLSAVMTDENERFPKRKTRL